MCIILTSSAFHYI